jgi:hypothetical protein
MPNFNYHHNRSDESYVAGLARGKIYREFRSADPNLRVCVGHANMLDRINDAAMKAASQHGSRKSRSRSRDCQSQRDSRIREISNEYISLKSQVEHIEEIEDSAENNLSLSDHFSIIGSEYKDLTSSSPVPTTVSVVSVEVSEEDDTNEFGRSHRQASQQRTKPASEYHHAPPLLISIHGRHD